MGLRIMLFVNCAVMVFGQLIELRDGSGLIQPPTYPTPTSSNRLRWILTVPDATSVILRFEDLDIPSPLSSSCSHNYVNLIDLNKVTPNGICTHKGPNADAGKTRFCNRARAPRPIALRTNKLLIEYCTQASLAPAGRGFKINYEVSSEPSRTNFPEDLPSTLAPIGPPGACSMDKNRSDFCGCGRSVVPPSATRIVGGKEARPHSWPWIVHLRRSYSGRFHEVCGAALISEQHIMTAAHCVDGNTDVNSYLARVGEHARSITERDEEDYAIEAIYIHPNYQRYDNDNDIAILRLARKVTLKAAVNTVCLPAVKGDPVPGSQATVVGWGETLPQEIKGPRAGNETEMTQTAADNSTIVPQAIVIGGPADSRGASAISNALMQLNIPIIDRSKCRGADYYGYQVTDNMFCAGFEEGRMDACKGDSGGPLVQRQNGRFTIIGVVSWGEGCAQPKKPGVYVQVSNYLNWIKSTLAR